MQGYLVRKDMNSTPPEQGQRSGSPALCHPSLPRLLSRIQVEKCVKFADYNSYAKFKGNECAYPFRGAKGFCT